MREIGLRGSGEIATGATPPDDVATTVDEYPISTTSPGMAEA